MMAAALEITPVSTIVLCLALIVVVLAAQGIEFLAGERAYGWLLAALLVCVVVAGAAWG